MDGNRKIASHQFGQPDRPYVGTTKPSLNVHLSVPTTTTAAQDGTHTPNTPEILNSIVKLQAEREAREANSAAGPFGAEFARQCAIQSTPTLSASKSDEMDHSISVPETLKAVNSGYNYMEPPTINVVPPLSSPDGSSVTSGSTMVSPISSPATTPSSGPGTIQQIRSQLIKEDLKMKIKQNMGDAETRNTKSRRTNSARTSMNEEESGLDNKESLASMIGVPSVSQNPPLFPMLSPTDSEEKYPIDIDNIKKEELTVDDAHRRSRRRERNKIAATKCRNKKKARTQILIRESETLTVQNQSLKNEIHKLEQEKVRLMQVLSGHENACLQRMQHDSAEIKSENLPSPIDENEFRVPSTAPLAQPMTHSQGSITTAPSFSLPVPSYTDTTTHMTLPLFQNNVPLVSNPNPLPFNISQTNQPDLHHQPLMTSSHDIAGTISPSECQPPSFADAVRVATEIKMEDNSQETIIQNTNHRQQVPQGFPPMFESDHLQQMNESHHDVFRAATFGNHSISDASSYFLAKRPLGHTYLDLDSRCIAL